MSQIDSKILLDLKPINILKIERSFIFVIGQQAMVDTAGSRTRNLLGANETFSH